tara:strand:- start:100 stop:813 length:714 start_codon:yes stop_codon:yes gene_type:complete
MAHGTYNNPRAGTTSSKSRMENLTKRYSKRKRGAKPGKGKFFITSSVGTEKETEQNVQDVSYGVSGHGIKPKAVDLEAGEEKKQIKKLHQESGVSSNTSIPTPSVDSDISSDKSSRKSKTITTWKRDKKMEKAMKEQGTTNPVYFDKKRKELELDYTDKSDPTAIIRRYDKEGNIKKEKSFSGSKYKRGVRRGMKGPFNRIEQGHINVSAKRVKNRKNTGTKSIWKDPKAKEKTIID